MESETPKKTHHYTKHLKEQREYPDYLINNVTTFIIDQLPTIKQIVDEFYTNGFMSEKSWKKLKDLCISVYEHDSGEIRYLWIDLEKIQKCKYLSNNLGSTIYNVREKDRFRYIKNFIAKYNAIDETVKNPEQYETSLMLHIISHIYYLLTETPK
jgi:hypothetical protein